MAMGRIALLLAITLFHYGSCITTPAKKVTWLSGKPRTHDRCASKIETRLESMKRRDSPTGRDASLDLSGYALHQRLRSLSYDMYVTGMRVRVPRKTGWFRVERCQYTAPDRRLDMRLVFRDLAVSGRVMLFHEDTREALPADSCNMTLRLRRAGLGITARPHQTSRNHVDIETLAQFVEPNFVSVYAYGCTLPTVEHRRGVADYDEGEDDEEDLLDPDGRIGTHASELGEEMENVFLKGVKTLLTTYMQKQLEPALRETLLSNLGYTLSYG